MASADFHDAVERALDLSRVYRTARAAVVGLTREFAESVRSVAGGDVNVELIDATGLESLVAAIAAMSTGARADPEDRRARQAVVVSGKGVSRALWEIEFDDAGYPVTLRGPERGAVVTCYDDEALREAFIDAASKGIVGRKIEGVRQEIAKALQDPSIHKKPTVQQDDAVPALNPADETGG